MSGVTRELAIRAACLYVPVAAVTLASWWRKPDRRLVGAAVLATAWALPVLLALNELAARAGWWRFAEDGPTIASMPPDLWIGWALLWGALPVLVDPLGRWRPATIAALAAVDFVAMPQLRPTVVLGSAWLAGEALGVAVVLVPALALARWTARRDRLHPRVWLQITAFAGLVFYVVPEIAFAATGTSTTSWSPLLARPRWHFVAFGLALLPFISLALQAVREFALIGRGTPLPLDPPETLVTTGPYAYVANPMQLAGTVLLIAWGAFLSNAMVMAAGVMAAIFSAGLAAFSEHRDLENRFGAAWADYRAQVRLWIPRWRPAPHAATIDVAATCDPCRDVGRFLAQRQGIGLVQRPAELRAEPPRRITYTAGGASEVGVGAIGRALEHASLGWALVGWTVRLPLVQPMAQLIADAVGAGPRDLRGAGVRQPIPK